MKKHKPGCACCEQGLEAVEKQEAKNMKTLGWYAHIVTDDPDYPYHFNYHTHGLIESFNHLDLQICCPIPPQVAHDIAISVIKLIKEGKSFEAGDTAFEVIENYPVTFAKARECDRDVLRIILPDHTGCLAKNEIDSAWAGQWESTNASEI